MQTVIFRCGRVKVNKMNNIPRLTLFAGFLFTLLLISIVILSLADKTIPEYLIVPLASTGTFLIGVITKYPSQE